MRAAIIGLRPRTPGSGRVCPTCGWPAGACRCSSREEEKVPERPVAKLRIEKKGRGGKTVTVVDGLPRNAAFLAALAHELKRACGTGGTAKETSVELQGDHRERVSSVLAARGFAVKGAIS
jgi:translation initiation factor 1